MSDFSTVTCDFIKLHYKINTNTQNQQNMVIKDIKQIII